MPLLLNETETAAAMEEIIADFESKYPNIDVQLEKVPSLFDVIANLKGKNPPEISRVETYFVSHLADEKLVRNLDEYIKKVEQLGGKIIMQKTTIPGFGYLAVFLDTENNTLGLWETDERAKM